MLPDSPSLLFFLTISSLLLLPPPLGRDFAAPRQHPGSRFSTLLLATQAQTPPLRSRLHILPHLIRSPCPRGAGRSAPSLLQQENAIGGGACKVRGTRDCDYRTRVHWRRTPSSINKYQKRKHIEKVAPKAAVQIRTCTVHEWLSRSRQCAERPGHSSPQTPAAAHRSRSPYPQCAGSGESKALSDTREL
ncbi:hypothetical protein U0070_004376 [Myodes glareolus]|uniref:Secreted protein n=1 Tax=Myodes glareolus TaxID=447135 RepID=A0AAW0IS23_MYOGA